jgi:beta-lactamase class A
VGTTRRQFTTYALGGLLVAACRPPAPAERQPTATPTFQDLEQRIGGRLGVFVLDSETGRECGQRQDERFAMASTFKWVLAACVLAAVERGELSLSESIPFGPADLLDHAPVAREHVGQGALSVETLAEAAVVVSDNTAANLLLRTIGGPSALTAFMRSQGDEVTRLDRVEPDLNSNDPGDPRDTTSPRAMVSLAGRLLLGETLRASSRERLLAWLVACATGKDRLRAGLPADWKAGDKTGGGAHAAVNDVAIAWPPGQRPILIASYSSEGFADLRELEAVHAEVAKRVVAWLSLPSPADR